MAAFEVRPTLRMAAMRGLDSNSQLDGCVSLHKKLGSLADRMLRLIAPELINARSHLQPHQWQRQRS